MPITSLYFPASLRRPMPYAPLDHARAEHAVELFEAGHHVEALDAALRYLLLPGGPEPALAREPMCLVQGTARIHLRVADGQLLVSAGLIRLNASANTVAVLRYILGEIAATGQLHQPRLRGDVLTVEFAERVALMHPSKFMQALKRLAEDACTADSWLQERFGVDMHDREPPDPLTEDEFERACAVWDAHWEATDALVDEVRRRRSTDLLNRVGAYARNQLEDVLPLQGDLYEWVNDAQDAFRDRDVPAGKRVDALATHVREARALSRDALRPGLGHARYALNPLREGTPSLLAKMLGGERRAQMLGELDAEGRTLEAALFRACDLQWLLAYHAWPAPVEQALRAALHGISGRPLREASESMEAQIRAIIQNFTRGAGEGEDEDEDEA